MCKFLEIFKSVEKHVVKTLYFCNEINSYIKRFPDAIDEFSKKIVYAFYRSVLIIKRKIDIINQRINTNKKIDLFIKMKDVLNEHRLITPKMDKVEEIFIKLIP